ncbi:hypothetical protein CALCODRAFT_486739 [Calocera cornea HHB12733]|uniref:Uncharacterized protein n=1 Tax=Calocera cornea HHB12733 TaxID=1353952 RepID=A0A165DJZ0_9BASI|nr:hypothetical protein CALCODRAFT_486739 [Calocera cornea HHB12733]
MSHHSHSKPAFYPEPLTQPSFQSSDPDYLPPTAPILTHLALLLLHTALIPILSLLLILHLLLSPILWLLTITLGDAEGLEGGEAAWVSRWGQRRVFLRKVRCAGIALRPRLELSREKREEARRRSFYDSKPSAHLAKEGTDDYFQLRQATQDYRAGQLRAP